MTDNEIIKGLECCNKEEPCGECPLFKTSYPLCVLNLNAEAYNLINRQKAEIEKLNKQVFFVPARANGKSTLVRMTLKSVANEAIGEFAEKLKELIYPQLGVEVFLFCSDNIDNLVKEMVGEDNDKL